MRYLRAVLLLIAITFSCVACADQAARVEAEALLDTMGMQGTLDKAIGVLLDAQIKQTPELAPYRGVMLDFFKKYMSYESLKPDLISIYESEFSASELREVRAFYATPAGQKMIEKIPQLMGKGAEIGARRVQDHIEELKQMINDEVKRLGKSQQEGAAQ